MKNYVCVIGSLNYDFFQQVNRMPKTGETMHANKVRFSCGGKGANQAYQMGKLGLDVLMIGCVGKDNYGLESIKSLKEVGVNTDYIKQVDTNTGLGFVAVQADGEVQAIIDKGANQFVTIDMIKENHEIIFQSKAIVLQMEIPLQTIEYIINEANNYDTLVFLNPAPAQPISNETLSKVDYLIVNEVEAAFYLDTEIDEKMLLEQVFTLRNKVKQGIVLTLGAKGSYYINKEKTYIPVVETNALDTTCAGDSYIGSFVYGVINGYSEVESCHFGSYSSSKTVEEFGRNSMPNKIKF